ncbi:MAG: MFS transporter [Propionibacteriaceae bacterium]|nr:MFS transporter [Propionibacteriaceae bacterium]
MTSPKTVGTGRLLTLILPATFGMYAVYQGVQNILLPAAVEEFDPARKVANLAVITILFSIASTIALPLGGALSDRTRSRFGRRTPWLAGSAVAAVAILAGLTQADGIVLLAVGCTLLWFVLNLYQAAITAVLPDRVPTERRGFASSIIGLATPLGVLIGVNLASRVSREAGYLLLGALFLVLAAAFVFGAPEGPSPDVRPAPETGGEKQTWAKRAAGFFASFKNGDFTLAFVSRALLFLAYFTVGGYMYYILQDHIGTDNLPGGDIAVAVSTVTSISVVVWVATSVVFGYLADKLNRRKLFVGISSAGMGCALAVPLLWPTWAGMLVYAVVGGLFFGIYIAVDLALMSLVLPDKQREGRDMGVLAVATAGAQILSPAIAGGLITLFNGYSPLFAFGAVCAIGGGLLAFRIRGVR